jgi:hypothetical protein
LVALSPVQDLLIFAKHLFSEARTGLQPSRGERDQLGFGQLASNESGAA